MLLRGVVRPFVRWAKHVCMKLSAGKTVMYGVRILGEEQLWLGPFTKPIHDQAEQSNYFRDSEVVKVTYEPVKIRKRNVKKEQE